MTQKTIITIIIVILVIFGIYYFVSHNNSATPSNPYATGDMPLAPTSSDTSLTTLPDATQNAVMKVGMKNFAFNPVSLAVETGTTVTWTNDDTVAHTVTSDPGSTTSFDSGSLAPGQSFSMTFNKIDKVNYHCTFHPMMKGIITVWEAQGK